MTLHGWHGNMGDTDRHVMASCQLCCQELCCSCSYSIAAQRHRHTAMPNDPHDNIVAAIMLLADCDIG